MLLVTPSIPMRYPLVFLVGVLACGDPPPSKYPVQQVVAEDTTLGARDLIDIRVYHQEELSGTFEVQPECTVTFPLIGAVTACGKTPSQLESEIRGALADGFLKNP